jgi:hypothetical protein
VLAVVAAIGLRAEMAAEIVVAVGVPGAVVDGDAGAVAVLAAVVEIAVAVGVRVAAVVVEEGTKLLCYGIFAWIDSSR